MAATPFVQTLIFRGASNNAVVHYPMTVSDVANEYAIGPDGLGQIQLASDQQYFLQDVIVDSGGVDTKFQDIFVNGLTTPLRITNKANLSGASGGRQFQAAPVLFKAGSLLRLKQSA